MAKGISTCKSCGKKIPTTEVMECSGKRYCIDCYNIKKQEGQEYKDLIKTICDYFEIEIPTGLIMKHVKEFKEQYNYTNGGMLYTLWYCKEVLNKQFDPKYGLAIIKYEYKNAENYYLQQLKIQESVQASASLEEKVREVKIKSKKNKRIPLLFNLDELIEEGEK